MAHRSLRLALAASVVAVLGLTAACGSSGPSALGTASAGGSKGADASVWVMSGVTEDVFNNSFASWNKAHADETFTTESFANDAYKQKIKTAIGAKTAPTLIYGWGGGTLQTYIDAGSVADLSDLASDPALKGRFLPSTAKVGVVDGKTYAVPNNGVKPVMIYYNKDVFAKIGAKPPATWDDLMALVPKFLDAGIAPFTVAGQAQWTLLPYLAYLIDRIGGPQVMANIVANKANAWSDPAVAQATRMIQQLVDAGGFVKGFASISTDGGADIALLYSGKAAMSLGLPSTYQTIDTANPEFISQNKLGFAPFPAVKAGTGDPEDLTGNPSNYWSISASGTPAQQKAARDYIKSDLLDASYVDDLLKIGNVPPVAGIEAKINASSAPEYYMTVYNMVKAAPSFQLSLDQALSPAAGQALLTNLQQVFLKQIKPQQFVDSMNATIGK